MGIPTPAPTKYVEMSALGRVYRRGHGNAHWSCQLRYGQYNCKDLSVEVPSHSERRLELLGIIAGLKALKYPCQVEVKTATDYIFDCGGRLLRPKSRDLFVGEVHRGTAK